MRQKSGFTVVESAIIAVPYFEQAFKKLDQSKFSQNTWMIFSNSVLITHLKINLGTFLLVKLFNNAIKSRISQ